MGGGGFGVVLVLAILREEAREEGREEEKRKNKGLEGKDGMTLKPRKTESARKQKAET